MLVLAADERAVSPRMNSAAGASSSWSARSPITRRVWSMIRKSNTIVRRFT